MSAKCNNASLFRRAHARRNGFGTQARKETEMRRTLICVVAAIALFAGVVLPAHGQDKKIVIGFAIGNTVEPFFQVLVDGARKAAGDLGVDVVVASADGDVARQLNTCEDFISNNVGAIILIPLDSTGLVPAVRNANKAGTPVVTADVAVLGGNVACHVAADNSLGGRLAARYLIDKLGGKGEVFILDNIKVTSISQRSDAFVAEIEKNAPGIKVVERTNVGFTRDACMKASEDLILTYPNLNAIFGAEGTDAGLGAAAAVIAAGKRNDIVVVNFDCEEESIALLKKGGPILADVYQNPFAIGYQAMEQAVKAAKGEKVEPEIKTEVKLITADNVDEL